VVLGVVVRLLIGAVGLAGVVPFGHVFVAPPGVAWIVAFYAGLLVVAGRRCLGLRAARAVLVPACVAALYLACRAATCPDAGLQATFVDVGHGTSVLLTSGRSAAVYDCGSGGPSSTYDVGRGAVAAQLWNAGVKRIGALLLSHTDSDHVNGVLSLMDRFPVGRIFVHRSFRDNETGLGLLREFDRRGIPVETVGAGDRIEFEDFALALLWPPKGDSGWRLTSPNDRSLVVRVTSGRRSLLLTGDIEQAGMGGLMATSDDLAAEVLYVPHHGAQDPVLGDFIRAVRPEYAVISSDSVGGKGRTEARRLLPGVFVYRTFTDGTVYFRAGPSGWSVRTEKP
jgi:competence protein ComEC